MAYHPDKSADFVGLERIKGTIGGRRGSLVLQHVGTFEDGAAKATLTMISGTDELKGATGAGQFVADPSGRITLTIEVYDGARAASSIVRPAPFSSGGPTQRERRSRSHKPSTSVDSARRWSFGSSPTCFDRYRFMPLIVRAEERHRHSDQPGQSRCRREACAP